LTTAPRAGRLTRFGTIWEWVWLGGFVVISGLVIIILLLVAVDAAGKAPRMLTQKLWPWLSDWRTGRFVVILIPVAAGLILWLFQPPDITFKNPHVLYLLSSMAQSLAAVVALVFTVSFVIVQLASSYSRSLSGKFFDPWIIIYLLFFLGSVVMPFVLLGQEQPNKWLVQLSLLFGVVSLILVVPYFLSFREKLRPGQLLDTVIREVRAPHRPSRRRVSEAINHVDEIVVRALERGDYPTIENGLKALVDLYRSGDNEIGGVIMTTWERIAVEFKDNERASNLLTEMMPEFE
jgi:hypothetical protein